MLNTFQSNLTLIVSDPVTIRINNAYILIYEHVPLTQEGGSESPVASQSKDPTPAMPRTTVPPHIENAVLNDNLVLLTACRLPERNYMYCILKRLKTMPSKDVLNRPARSDTSRPPWR